MNKAFVCKKCGKCCFGYSIPLSTNINDIQIDFLVKAKGYAFRMTDLGPFLYSYDRCSHLTSDNKCDIYEERPEICKMHTC